MLQMRTRPCLTFDAIMRALFGARAVPKSYASVLPDCSQASRFGSKSARMEAENETGNAKKKAGYEIQGKTCLITGGAVGMGAQHVQSYLKEGAKFVAILDIAEDKGKTLAETLTNTYPGKVEFFKCNVGNEESVTAAFDSVLERLGQLDIVINNAGILNELDGWRNTCDVNWLGLVSFSIKAQKHMRKDLGGAGGTIINASSVSALVTAPTIPIYSGSKAAVVHFSRCLAMTPFTKTGVRVITVCFSGTDTSFCHGFRERIDPTNLGTIRDIFTRKQQVESAGAACVEIYKRGENGSVWISQNNDPAEDITQTIAKAYDLMKSVIVI